jgi:hypothetical protein
MSFKSDVDGGRLGLTVNNFRACVLVLNRIFWLAAVSSMSTKFVLVRFMIAKWRFINSYKCLGSLF